MLPAQSGQRSRISAASLGSLVMWTAVALGLMELANAIACRAARSRREMGTITIGSAATSLPSGMRSSAKAASTVR